MSPQIFLLNPRNRRALEGDRRPFASETLPPVFMMLFMVPFVLIGVGFVAYTIYQGYQRVRFANSGVDVRGAVTRLWDHKSYDDSDPTFYVAYEYGLDPSDDKTNTGESTIDEGTYTTLKNGDPISVRYLKTDPKRSRIPGQGQSLGGILLFTVFWNLIVGTMSWILTKMILRQRRLRRGRLVSGEVIGATVKSDSDGDCRFTLHYRFTSPEGRELTASADCIRNDLKGETLPQPGTPLVVQYAENGDSEPL